MSPRAVFFDFDGLMVDTETHEYTAWKRIFERYGTELPLEEWSVCIGTMDHGFDPVGFLGERISQSLDRQALLEEHREHYRKGSFSAPLREGFEARLKEADQLGWLKAVVSSSTRDWVEAHLRCRNLSGVFDLIQTSEEVSKTKPDPELYLRALEKLDLSPNQAIVLEDSEHGVEAAWAAGLYTIAVPNPVTRHLSFAKADRIVNSLAEIRLRDFIQPDRDPT